MRHVPGTYDAQILEAMQSKDEDLHFEAIIAAGAKEIDKAWPHIAALLSPDTDRDLLIAAIDAAPTIRPEEAIDLLHDLSESIEDEEIEEAIEEALLMARGLLNELEEDEFDDEEFDGDEDEEEEPGAKRPN